MIKLAEAHNRVIEAQPGEGSWGGQSPWLFHGLLERALSEARSGLLTEEFVRSLWIHWPKPRRRIISR